MGDYERSATVPMPVDDLFEYLSHVENLPTYMARMTQARQVSGDEVSVEARLEPGDGASSGSGEGGPDGGGPDGGGPDGGGERTVRGEAWFRIDAERHRLEWGAAGPHDYHGELEVSEGGSGATVVVRLHTLHDDTAAIEEGLAETLSNIERITV